MNTLLSFILKQVRFVRMRVCRLVAMLRFAGALVLLGAALPAWADVNFLAIRTGSQALNPTLGTTGTGPFPIVGPGGATDPAANDEFVLTNDTVGYEVEYTVNNTPLPLNNVVMVFDLPRHPGDPLTGIPANTPYASWSGGVALPSGCVLSSTTVGGVTAANQRATCTFASIAAVGNNFLPFRVQTNPQMVNNTVMPSPIATATWQGKVGGPKPADVTSVNVTMKAGGILTPAKAFKLL